MTHRRGFTLLEMVCALSITAILLGAIASAVVLATRSLPTSSDAFSSPIAAARITDQIAGELETATVILDQTPISLTFLVPARNGDSSPERIRYSWAGTPGMPLTRQYNAGAAATLIDQVDQFSLTPVIATFTESYPGIATEDSTDSLLIDYSGTSGLASQNINGSNWAGQYFASNSWPAGVVGWRPTRFRFQAKQSGLLATTNVQARAALANLTPAATVLEQYTLAGSGLLSSYQWQQFTFTTLDRLAPPSGICFTLQWVLGTPNSVTVQTTSSGAGMVQTTNAGGSWTYQGATSLQSQLYGKLTHAGPAQYAVSKYLSALTVTLRAGGSANTAATTTAQLLNHPPMLSAYWELKFDKDPTTADVNGDHQGDWTVHGGGTFNVSSLVNGTWLSNGAGIDSSPGDTFSRLTIVDLRMEAIASGSWAGFNINAARSGATCAPVLARITAQSDGSQTLSVWRRLNDTTTDVLLTVPGLPAQPNDLHLIIDPAYGSVGIAINGVEYGSFAYNAYSSIDPSQSASLSSSGSAQFTYVRIREMLP